MLLHNLPRITQSISYLAALDLNSGVIFKPIAPSSIPHWLHTQLSACLFYLQNYHVKTDALLNYFRSVKQNALFLCHSKIPSSIPSSGF